MYPTDYPSCIMCGAAEGKPCTVISTVTDGPDRQTAGDRRDYPHAARAKPGEHGPREGFVAIKDEPDWSDSAARS